MKKINKLQRIASATTAVALLAGISLQVLPGRAFAATQITNRSLLLESGTVSTRGNGIFDGGSEPAGHVKHLFTFSLHDGTDQVGSMTFQYCTTAAPVPNGLNCTAPGGINVSGATQTADTGASGFTTLSTSNATDNATTSPEINKITIGRSSAATLTLSGGSLVTTKEFSNIINPTSAMTFFVRIATYTSLNGTGAPLETGTVAAATSTQIDLSGTMPESLVFCAGAKISLTNSVPDCSTVTTGAVAFDRLFSPTDTALATSQMAASTNAGQGYAIAVHGPTLTSGSNTIAAMATTDTSKHGISQFGMNLVLNAGTEYANAPNFTNMVAVNEPNGANIAPTSNGTNYRGNPKTAYATAGSFTYIDGDVVADSSNGSLGGTDAQIYTNSYIVNVPGSQPAGTYSSTLTYICTPTF